MLLFGEANILPVVQDDVQVVLNLSSMINMPSLNLYPPDIFKEISNEKEWDIAYANWILANDEQFISLLQIVYPLYLGLNVFVIVDWFHYISNSYLANMNESIIKLIQQRYGYCAAIINTPEDYLQQNKVLLESSFSIDGLANIDIDKDRLAYLYASNRDEFDSGGFVYGFVNDEDMGDE